MSEDSVAKSYNKPALSIEEQISLLKQRGLIIEPDDELLKYYLKNVSYYHLSIYFKLFQVDDAFLEATTFDDILRIYTFDNKLRFLLLELLERVEKSFKCRIAYELSMPTKNAHCYLDSDIFQSKSGFADMNSIFNEVTEKNKKELSIKHYKSKYPEPSLPPIWMMVEILSFGQCVKLGKNLTKEWQRIISRTFGADEMFVMSWMHSLSILRNHCAHHSRLWNRDFTFRPSSRHKLYKDFFVKNNQLFNYLVALQILLAEINPTSSWLDKLERIVGEHDIDVSHMGFPEDWKAKLIKVKEIAIENLGEIEK